MYVNLDIGNVAQPKGLVSRMAKMNQRPICTAQHFTVPTSFPLYIVTCYLHTRSF